MVGIPVIILVVSTMFLSSSPCAALEVPLPDGQTTLDVAHPIDESVVVKTGGTLNLLDGGIINGAVGIEDGGILNMQGGYVRDDVFVASGSDCIRHGF